MQARRLKTIKKFIRDTEALVTVQVVIFSVMLFGGIGLMMDFGRAYSAHSHMQSYIDQVALAAARELDQTTGAIERAKTAADNVAGSSSFVDSGDFSYSEIVWLTGAPTNSNGDYDEGMLSTLNTANSLLATHVLVRSSNESVALQLLNFATSRTEDGITEIALRTQAVATSRKVACGGMSPLVMCNPFEGDGSTSFREAMSQGYRMHLTTDDMSAESLDDQRPLATSGKIQLGLLKNPVNTMHVRNTACSDLSNLPGNTFGTGPGLETDPDIERLRDICLLATVDTGLSCVNDQVIYKAADPETVLTGLNVIFDMFDGSMTDIIEPTVSDPLFVSPFEDNLGTMISRSSLFFPDASATKGRMSREDYAQHMDEQIFTEEWKTHEALSNLPVAGQPVGEVPPCPPGVPVFLCPQPEVMTQAEIDQMEQDIINENAEEIANLEAEKLAYATYTSNPVEQASRVNYVRDIGEDTEWGFPTESSCLLTQQCSLHGAIDAAGATSSNDVDTYAASFYQPYILRELASIHGVADWWDSDAESSDGYELATLIDVDYITNGESYQTYYDFYVAHEQGNPLLQEPTAVYGTSFPSVTNLDVSDSDAAANYEKIYHDAGEFGLSTKPENFLLQYPNFYTANPTAATTERRRKRVTVVNCSSAETYSEATGGSATGYGGAFVGDVVDVVDVFLLAPPEVTACAVDPGDDPQSNFLCDNADVSSAFLDVEFLDSATANPVGFDSRTFAVLVH